MTGGPAEPAAEPLGEASKPPRTPLTGFDDDPPECRWCDRPLVCRVCDGPPDEVRARTFKRLLASYGLMLVDERTGQPPAQLGYLVERLMHELDATQSP